jgi:hypothetical protein
MTLGNEGGRVVKMLDQPLSRLGIIPATGLSRLLIGQRRLDRGRSDRAYWKPAADPPSRGPLDSPVARYLNGHVLPLQQHGVEPERLV